jgi:hypothetical protein
MRSLLARLQQAEAGSCLINTSEWSPEQISEFQAWLDLRDAGATGELLRSRTPLRYRRVDTSETEVPMKNT